MWMKAAITASNRSTLGTSTIFIASAALLSDVFPKHERVRAISLWRRYWIWASEQVAALPEIAPQRGEDSVFVLKASHRPHFLNQHNPLHLRHKQLDRISILSLNIMPMVRWRCNGKQ